MHEKILLIGDVRRLLQVSDQTIKNYIGRGILEDRRTPQGWRVFLLSEVERLKAKLIGERPGDE